MKLLLIDEAFVFPNTQVGSSEWDDFKAFDDEFNDESDEIQCYSAADRFIKQFAPQVPHIQDIGKFFS